MDKLKLINGINAIRTHHTFSRIVFSIFFVLNTCICSSQSVELKNAYNQVVNTLKGYEFEFQGLSTIDFEIKSFNVSFKHPSLVLSKTVKSKYHWASDSDKMRTGNHKIEIPIASTTFEVKNGRYFANSSYLNILNSSGITYIYNGKRELMESYEIMGSKLNISKLCEELNILKKIIIEEKYTGSLGNNGTQQNANNKIKSTPKQSKSGRYVE